MCVLVFLRMVLRLFIHMNVLNFSDIQEPSCKIWYVIMRNLYRNEVLENWKTVGMKGMEVIELFTISTVPFANDEILLSNSDEELQRASYHLFKSGSLCRMAVLLSRIESVSKIQ